jgi:uracil-DNA glycosylase family 4
VKHFKWEPRGKRRIHKKPNAVEIQACRPWLDAEIRVVKPRAIVCLGSTAAQAVIGPKFRVSIQRGQFVKSDLAEFVTATVHPSSILRAPTDDARHAETARFIDDLKKIRAVRHGGEHAVVVVDRRLVPRVELPSLRRAGSAPTGSWRARSS